MIAVEATVDICCSNKLISMSGINKLRFDLTAADVCLRLNDAFKTVGFLASLSELHRREQKRLILNLFSWLCLSHGEN